MVLFRSVLFSCFVCLSAGAGWNYDDPSTWAASYPKCGGKKQSPINIVKSDVQCDVKLAKSLTLTNYNQAGSGDFTVKIKGRTLQVIVASADASMSLAGIGKFDLAQFHFHWGSDDSRGSEHKIDGKSYAAELHFVHYNSKYPSLGEAVNKSDGLAVLGALIEKGAENAAFKKFLNSSKYNVTNEDTSAKVKSFALQELLPENRTSFYRYNGSLTVPNCDESVTWTLLAQPIQISNEQLEELRNLKSHGKPLVDNYRPVQALNGRTVLSSFQTGGCGAGIQIPPATSISPTTSTPRSTSIPPTTSTHGNSTTGSGSSIKGSLFSVLLFTLVLFILL
uniref:Carbonic anhydrase n=1 Tax=Corallium rubrum TaxID=142104 RepID=A0A1B0Y2D5_9CNID|nr:alpha carbonic anhydrase 5 [Corallium rubrum]